MPQKGTYLTIKTPKRLKMSISPIYETNPNTETKVRQP